jgi:hypothetical protein
MLFATPSYKRATNCKTALLLPEVTIFCHEFEVAEYKAANKNKICPIPDDLQKQGMAKIRNFILEQVKVGESVVMFDDDISRFGYIENGEQIEITNPKLVYNLFTNLEIMAREMGTSVFGINQQSDPKFYREYSPLSLLAPVLGPALGIIRTELRFDEDLGLKEDYDYSVQALRKHRRILRHNKYHYIADHIKLKGGCSIYRNVEKESQQMKLLEKKWGSGIIKADRKTQGGNVTINPKFFCPIKGI